LLIVPHVTAEPAKAPQPILRHECGCWLCIFRGSVSWYTSGWMHRAGV